MASPKRMSLRKREAPTIPTAEFARHRAALISRFAKRPRESDDGTESDASARREASPETDRSLTFLQSAQLQNTPVRSGKWNVEEENYLRKLVQIFNAGVLEDVEQRSSMRMWLAKMLHCCPMRISKKQMHGEKFKGKAKYTRNHDRIDRMGQKEFDKTTREVHQLRADFLKHWAKEEFGRWGTRESNFGEWYDTIIRTVPTPKLARNNRLAAAPQKPMEPWEEVSKYLVPLVIVEDIEAQHTRELARKKRALARYENKRFAEAKQFEEDNRCFHETIHANSLLHGRQAPRISDSALFVSVHEQSEGCPGPCCKPPLICLEEIHDEVFEPMPELDVGQDDLASIESRWEDHTPPLTKLIEPTGGLTEPLPLETYTPPGIVLDFGPPSLWNVDVDIKDQKSPSNCEWVDELLGEDMMLTFEPSMLMSYDLLFDSWPHQNSSGFTA